MSKLGNYIKVSPKCYLIYFYIESTSLSGLNIFINNNF